MEEKEKKKRASTIITLFNQVHVVYYRGGQYQHFLTLIWNTKSPLIQATNPDRVILPAPLTPINR